MLSPNDVPASLRFIYVLLPSCIGWLLTLGMYFSVCCWGGRVGLQTLDPHVLDCRLQFAFRFLYVPVGAEVDSNATYIDNGDAVLRIHVPSFASRVQIYTPVISEVEAKRVNM